MAELGVKPYPPSKRGRGHSWLYDATEIIHALKDERERQLAQKEKRPHIIRRAPHQPSLADLPWREAKKILTAQGALQ